MKTILGNIHFLIFSIFIKLLCKKTAFIIYLWHIFYFSVEAARSEFAVRVQRSDVNLACINHKPAWKHSQLERRSTRS